MKLKGVKPFEQHFEKLIVAVLAALFLLVLLTQFVMQPNMVEVIKREILPGAAYGPIQEQAERLKVQLLQPDPALPEASDVDIASSYRESLRGGVAPRQRLSLHIPGVSIEVSDEAIFGHTGNKFVEFVPIAPSDPTLGVVMNTLNPLLVRRTPELAAFLPSEQPYDKAVVTIEALFDGIAQRQLLERDPDDEGELMPMRSNWWRNIQILAVRLEREELTDTGEWTDLRVIDPIPASTTVLEDLDTRATNTRALEMIAASAARLSTQIRQPDYYASIAGPQWMAPSDFAQAEAQSSAQEKIDRLLVQLVRAEDDLVTLGERKQAVQQDRRRANNFDMPIERKEIAIEKLKDELRALGHAFADDPDPLDEQDRFNDPRDRTPLLEDDAVRIWAHDITAEPGVTYRYRIGVVMNNPVFGRHPVMHEDQKVLADQPLALGEMSRWSQPVEVDRKAYFFVTNARAPEREALARTRATVDVFRFYYGFWRKGTTSVHPGDLIVATVEIPENLYTFDLDRAPRDQEGRVDPAELIPLEEDDKGNMPDPPEWWRPTPTHLDAVIDAQILDVSLIPGDSGRGIGGRSRPRYQAILRTLQQGRLFVRRPAAERSSTRYRELLESAALGLTQGQPVVTDLKPEPGQGPQDPFADPDPEGSGGGGGGGGG
ncbi:MAG: hypothetical protein IID31_07375 [Planctomycetes bacterium]|nr:hypothetical protein [Planctomycetota bacterium]